MNNKFLPYQEAWIKSDHPMVDVFSLARGHYKLQMSVLKCLRECLIKDGAAVVVSGTDKEYTKAFLERVVSVIKEMPGQVRNKLGADIEIQSFEDVSAIVFENRSIIVSGPASSNERIKIILEKLHNERHNPVQKSGGRR
jgi:3-phosphoglycerate kinase